MQFRLVGLGLSPADELTDVRYGYRGEHAEDSDDDEKFDQGKTFLSVSELLENLLHLAPPFNEVFNAFYSSLFQFITRELRFNGVLVPRRCSKKVLPYARPLGRAATYQ